MAAEKALADGQAAAASRQAATAAEKAAAEKVAAAEETAAVAALAAAAAATAPAAAPSEEAVASEAQAQLKLVLSEKLADIEDQQRVALALAEVEFEESMADKEKQVRSRITKPGLIAIACLCDPCSCPRCAVCARASPTRPLERLRAACPNDDWLAGHGTDPRSCLEARRSDGWGPASAGRDGAQEAR